MAIYLDDKVQNGQKDVLQYLGLKHTDIPRPRRKEFEVYGGKRDPDGNLRIAKSIYGVAQYTIFVPMLGREVKVRLAKSQTPNKDKGFEYSPKNIGIEPAEDGTVLITDELEFLFWYLRPMNSQSPFRAGDAKAFYEFKDNEAKAKAEQDVEEARIDALSLIYGVGRKSERELKTLAKGMNIPGVDDMSLPAVQSELKKLANANPREFYSMANSREIQFSGKIQEAIEQNIVELKSINGMKRWYLMGEEILPLQNGVDDVKALKEFLSEKWYMFADTIQNGLDGKNTQTNLNSPENDEFFADPHVGPVMKAEVSPEISEMIKEFEKDSALKDKISKLAALDPNDPNLHFMKKKSIESNQHYIDAYRESQKEI